MAQWYDFFRLFSSAFSEDPLTRKRQREDLTGAALSQADAVPNIRGGLWAGNTAGIVRLRDSTDFIDLSTVTNRQSRYKEYERLRHMPEIETAMTVFADESCVSGDTNIATLFWGHVPIKSIPELLEKRKIDRFAVYCFDFEKDDFTIGWAHSPRIVKESDTVKIALSNGRYEIVTEDHQVLKRNGKWVEAGELKKGDELMPFHKVLPNRFINENLKTGQFPRIFTLTDSWKHERQFIDEWKTNKPIQKYKKLCEVMKLIRAGAMRNNIQNAGPVLQRHGFSYQEVKFLDSKYPDRQTVLWVGEHKKMEVWDLSVDEYENFATDSLILHNCQMGENDHTYEIRSKNEDVMKEIDLLFSPKILDIDGRIWNWAKNLFVHGDAFFELVISPEKPSLGVIQLKSLPADSMYRIETVKGRLLEFQQSKEGPDFQSLARVEIEKASDADLAQATALRFTPEQIIHMRIGEDRKTFYPYGVSLIEAARGPAHSLRLMEDSMIVYRLTRAPERRIFYIDVGLLSPSKVEAFIDRMKDQFRKKKVPSGRNLGQGGANAVEERWRAPAVDDDYWVPMRPDSQTRVETLPGATNLGEIDDAIYFRNKLFIALNFPKNYMLQEDPSLTRVTLSSQDIKFARMVERLQRSMVSGLRQVAVRHLVLRGFPEESYDDLKIMLTSPSDWRLISRSEVLDALYNRAASMKGAQLMSDYDILVDILRFDESKAKEYVSRMKMQKLEELKLQVMAQNPQLLGVAQPGQGELEMGVEPGGPNPMLGGEEQAQLPSPQEAPPGELPPEETAESLPLSEPSEEDVQKYDLEISGYEQEQDEEEIDRGELDEI